MATAVSPQANGAKSKTNQFGVYVKNVPPYVNEIELHHLFSQHGNVADLKIKRDPRFPYGRAYVFMKSEVARDKAAAACNRQLFADVYGRTNMIYTEKFQQKTHIPVVVKCEHCGVIDGGAVQLKNCPVCKTPYCSEKCQHEDWKAGHKSRCKDIGARRENLAAQPMNLNNFDVHVSPSYTNPIRNDPGRMHALERIVHQSPVQTNARMASGDHSDVNSVTSSLSNMMSVTTSDLPLKTSLRAKIADFFNPAEFYVVFDLEAWKSRIPRARQCALYGITPTQTRWTDSDVDLCVKAGLTLDLPCNVTIEQKQNKRLLVNLTFADKDLSSALVAVGAAVQVAGSAIIVVQSVQPSPAEPAPVVNSSPQHTPDPVPETPAPSRPAETVQPVEAVAPSRPVPSTPPRSVPSTPPRSVPTNPTISSPQRSPIQAITVGEGEAVVSVEDNLPGAINAVKYVVEDSLCKFIAVGDAIKIVIEPTSIESVQSFYAQVLNDKCQEIVTEVMQTMQVQMNQYCSHIANKPPPIYRPDDGDYILAPFEGSWFRGLVTALDDADSRAAIAFLDFGNYAVVPFDQLLPMPARFTKLPVIALNMGLHGVNTLLDELKDKQANQELMNVAASGEPIDAVCRKNSGEALSVDIMLADGQSLAVGLKNAGFVTLSN